ncbi:hypothetical protein FRC17_000949 [Serendipita sp. 399]|nr:hypothetical protein FRC17_000949 [Serendipita sp. 399]
MAHLDEKSLLEQLDQVAPIKKFDAFPKLPASYKSRTKFGGFMTVFVIALSFVLILNDVGEFIWGWSDYEFTIDKDQSRPLEINVDVVVNTPCSALSVDLRDAVGDRLHLSDTITRDGTLFDIGQAHEFKEHQRALSTREIVAASRRSRGFFSMFKASRPQYRPTWNHTPAGSACRIYGSFAVRKLTGNFHITALGHGYGGVESHASHDSINMSHVITEFSFGPYYPDITQPLDYSFETTDRPFVAFQYFITVVPTTYIAPRSRPLQTSQYSVTHYIKDIDHGRGTPGIFFKYEIDPIALEIHQRTTSLIQFLVRIVGVIGGVWVCFGWAFKVAAKVSQKAGITSDDDEPITSEVTGMSAKKRWRGSNLGLRRRNPDDTGSNWSTPMASPFVAYSNQGTPASPYATFSAQGAPSPYAAAQSSPYYAPPSRSGSNAGYPPSPSSATHHLAPSSPYSPAHFPASPLPGQSGFSSSGLAPPSPRPGSANLYAPSSPSPYTPSSAGNGTFAVQQSNSRPSSIVGTPPPPRSSPPRPEKKED